MKKIRTYKEIELMNNIDHQSRIHLNCFKYNSHNSDAHEQVKFEIFKKLIKQQYLVFTEAKFIQDRGIGDLVAIKKKEAFIIEILHTETEKRLDIKRNKYPEDFVLIKVHTKDFKIDDFEL